MPNPAPAGPRRIVPRGLVGGLGSESDVDEPDYPGLDRIVERLRDLRSSSHRTRYQDRPPPELPSRKAIIELIDGLVGALFPRHFGPPGLPADGWDAFVAAALATSLRELEQQVRRELLLTDEEVDPGQQVYAAKAHQIANVFAEGLPEIRAMLESDILAAFEGDPAAKSLDEVMSCYPGVTAIIRHRLAHRLYRLGAPMLGRIISEVAHSATGIDIHPGAEIGEGLFIDHGTGVVIGETAIVGRRVRLYQAVTLGAKRFEVDERGALVKNYPRHPIIEDDVVIYAGATILGRITIGRGSIIAGNVWLTHSVPPGSEITQARLRGEGIDEDAGSG
jgi:serine O-acetyltransferase